jgi:hypothetical protein
MGKMIRGLFGLVWELCSFVESECLYMVYDLSHVIKYIYGWSCDLSQSFFH